jgi:integrase/recombinase XerD
VSIRVSRVPVSGPLGDLAPGFVAELERKNYTPSSASAQVQMMARLSGWLARGGLDACDLTPEVAERFVATLRAAGYRNSRSWRGLGTLLGYLRGVGAAPALPSPLAPPQTAEQELLDRYQRYLTGERGICVATASGYLSKARRFLAWRAVTGGVGLEGLTAADVSAFVLAECPGRSTNWGRQLTLALRSFLVFGHVDGVLGESLASAVPRVAGWRLAGLPRALEPGVIQRLIVSCDRATAIGRRDHAILLLLWRLALRRGDVAAMKLDDIDWCAGEVVVCGKSRRVERLPLPCDVGESLAGYLQRDRPRRIDARTVFVAVRAPHRPLTPTAVNGVVARASARAAVSGVTAHRLRHTAATEMLRAGASLTEIGQVLRHRQLQTTAIYAKADVETLRSLARPWPGSAT